jgi:hypothetical protein
MKRDELLERGGGLLGLEVIELDNVGDYLVGCGQVL